MRMASSPLESLQLRRRDVDLDLVLVLEELVLGAIRAVEDQLVFCVQVSLLVVLVGVSQISPHSAHLGTSAPCSALTARF